MAFCNFGHDTVCVSHSQVTDAAVIPESSCPMDCICYPDYLSNLASWKWIETKGDLHTDQNDQDHEEFNPYTEHNEVNDLAV